MVEEGRSGRLSRPFDAGGLPLAGGGRPVRSRGSSVTRIEAARRYPRLVAHVIAESLGYATPGLAAAIVADAREGRSNFCEWIACCYGADPRQAVRAAIRRRHGHRGYMADYRLALELVRRYAETGAEPLFASWF